MPNHRMTSVQIRANEVQQNDPIQSRRSWPRRSQSHQQAYQSRYRRASLQRITRQPNETSNPSFAGSRRRRRWRYVLLLGLLLRHVYPHGVADVLLDGTAVLNLNSTDNTLAYAYGGHPPALVRRSKKRCSPILLNDTPGPANLPLGVMRRVHCLSAMPAAADHADLPRVRQTVLSRMREFAGPLTIEQDNCTLFIAELLTPPKPRPLVDSVLQKNPLSVGFPARVGPRCNKYQNLFGGSFTN